MHLLCCIDGEGKEIQYEGEAEAEKKKSLGLHYTLSREGGKIEEKQIYTKTRKKKRKRRKTKKKRKNRLAYTHTHEPNPSLKATTLFFRRPGSQYPGNAGSRERHRARLTYVYNTLLLQ